MFDVRDEFIINIGRTTIITPVKSNEYNGICTIELNPKDLYDLVIKYLPLMLKKYLKEVK